MSVFKKLQQARITLQNMKLEKTGHNKFAGYKYFELGDFLPAINSIFNEIGLCGVVSYSSDIATLTITDIDDGSQILITSPMADANLKGCHPIQNLGAVETYTRRYLWVAAMEIVEHDALDSSQPLIEPKAHPKIEHPLDVPAYDLPTPERMEALKDIASEIVDFHTKGFFEDAFVVFDNISDNSERNELWKILKPNSAVRTKLTEIGNAKKAGK
jgi:ERF superfamily